MSRIIKFAVICGTVYKLKELRKKKRALPLHTHSFLFGLIHGKCDISCVKQYVCFFFSLSVISSFFSIFIFPISVHPFSHLSMFIVWFLRTEYKLRTNENEKVSKVVTVVVSGWKRLTFDMAGKRLTWRNKDIHLFVCSMREGVCSFVRSIIIIICLSMLFSVCWMKLNTFEAKMKKTKKQLGWLHNKILSHNWIKFYSDINNVMIAIYGNWYE